MRGLGLRGRCLIVKKFDPLLVGGDSVKILDGNVGPLYYRNTVDDDLVILVHFLESVHFHQLQRILEADFIPRNIRLSIQH